MVKKKKNSSPCTSELVLLTAVALLSFLDSALQLFLHAKHSQTLPTCIFFHPTLGISNFWYSAQSFSPIFASGYIHFAHRYMDN